MADELSHLTDQGEVHMVEVGDRAITKREATAAGTLVMQPSTLELVLRGDTPKETCWRSHASRPSKGRSARPS